MERVITRDKVDFADRRLPLRGGARDAGSGDGLQEGLPRRRLRRMPSWAPTSRRTTIATSTGSASRRPRTWIWRARCSRCSTTSGGRSGPTEDRTRQGRDPRGKGGLDRGHRAAMQKNLPAMKMEVVGVWQPSAVATDVTAELSAIDRAAPTSSSRRSPGPVGISVGRQMGERNMKAVAFGINVEGQKDEFWAAAAGKANSSPRSTPTAEVEYHAQDHGVREGVPRALQEVADLHGRHLRRHHAAEGRHREAKAPPTPTRWSPTSRRWSTSAPAPSRASTSATT